MHLCITIPAKTNIEADEIQFQEIPSRHRQGVPGNVDIDFRLSEFMDQNASFTQFFCKG